MIRQGRHRIGVASAMAAAVVVGLFAGCVAHRQVQFFEVIDPVTGNVNYYRMTLEGGGALGASYQMQAGYFSAASVDVLRGQMPSMPEVDLPIKQDAAFDALVAGYYDGLLRAAESGGSGGMERREVTQAPVDSQPGESDPPDGIDAEVLARARLVWFGQLSPADVASMGMHGSTNPFQFRKLVFWTSAKQVDLRQFGAEIDSVMASATALVRAEKAEAKERSGRMAGLRRFARELVQGNAALAPYAGLVDALLPGNESVSSGTTPTTNTPAATRAP